MENIRDIVVVVAGIIWSLVFLVILIAVLIVFALVRNYLNAAHGFLRGRVRTLLDGIYGRIEALNTRTGQLSSRPPLTPAPTGGVLPPGLSFRIPFPWRRKPWWERVLHRMLER